MEMVLVMAIVEELGMAIEMGIEMEMEMVLAMAIVEKLGMAIEMGLEMEMGMVLVMAIVEELGMTIEMVIEMEMEMAMVKEMVMVMAIVPVDMLPIHCQPYISPVLRVDMAALSKQNSSQASVYRYFSYTYTIVRE